MDAAVEEIEKKVSLSGVFAEDWPQVRDRWLRCRKMMESAQRRAEEAQAKWCCFENDIAAGQETVKKLLAQLIQAIENMKNGVKDVSFIEIRLSFHIFASEDSLSQSDKSDHCNSIVSSFSNLQNFVSGERF